MNNVISMPPPKRWATLRPWPKAAVIRHLYDGRVAAQRELTTRLRELNADPSACPSVIALNLTLLAQACEGVTELEGAVAEAEATAAHS